MNSETVKIENLQKTGKESSKFLQVLNSIYFWVLACFVVLLHEWLMSLSENFWLLQSEVFFQNQSVGYIKRNFWSIIYIEMNRVSLEEDIGGTGAGEWVMDLDLW